jgi:NAD-dependent dihydropyrimidine dehydrogenase PreA subunit
VLSLSIANPLSACDIGITPSETSGSIGETITFDVVVTLTHRNCPVPIEDTLIELERMTLIDQTTWKAVGSRTYSSQITVQLISDGAGQLTVTRVCIKGGDVALANVFISASPNGESNIPIIPDPINATPISPLTQVTTSEISWGEAFTEAVSQPFIIAYLALTVLAYVAFRKQVRKWRFVSLTFSMIYLGFFLGLCPCTLGSLQNAILHTTEIKTYMANFVLLAIPVVSTLFWGRLFCGWICPMGAVQQLLHRRDMAIKVPVWLHNILKYFRYLVLFGLVIAVVLTGTAVFAQIDPFKSLFNLEISLVPTTLLVLTIVASLFIFVPWCRYACPMGAFLSLLTRFSLFRLRFTETCKNCGACAKAYCSSKAISVSEITPVISDTECMRCGDCLSRCPKDSIVFGKEQELVFPAKI